MRPLTDIRQVLVFRALMLGDLLCATPALRALRAGMPKARIILCGLERTAELAQRLPTVDEFLPFPGHPALPEQPPPPGALEAFVATLQRRCVDLALQMHGSGDIVNPLLLGCGARGVAGFTLPGTERGLELAVPWPVQGTEIERCLALTDALGVPRDGMHLDFPLIEQDRRTARALLADLGVRGRYALVHPGSQLPSRRWAPERFARVAEALAARGLAVVITGSAAEAALAAAVRAVSRPALIDLTGRTPSLWVLGALVEAAAVVVSNDTGISHVAAALRTPSVVIACGSDVARWSPLDRGRHRVHWHATPCRPCAHAVCPTGHECAAGVTPPAVLDSALALLGA